MADEDTVQPILPVSEPAQPVSEAASESFSPTESQQPTETQTAQIPANEPLPPEPKPIPAPQGAAATAAPVPNFARDLLVKARATIQSRKHKKLEKILEFLSSKGKITNDEVEKLLHVSDATATRYLSALEKEGKIKQVGKTGTRVEYTRI